MPLWRGMATEAHEGWLPTTRPVRNVAVIAHVDHGKTSLVDCLLHASGALKDSGVALGERVMDSNQLERERGITIFSKSTSFYWNGRAPGVERVLFNIVDTPGHADFGGEVERVLHMVDSVMLVVCAHEGPMPQTRFVLSKALRKGLSPLVVVNKADRSDARLGSVETELLDLLMSLNASDAQLDSLKFWYASAREGWCTDDSNLDKKEDFGALLDALRAHVPPPKIMGGADEPFRLLCSQIDADPYVGKLVTGRVASGSVRMGTPVKTIRLDGTSSERGVVTRIQVRRGMVAEQIDEAVAGDIVSIAGLLEHEVPGVDL